MLWWFNNFLFDGYRNAETNANSMIKKNRFIQKFTCAYIQRNQITDERNAFIIGVRTIINHGPWLIVKSTRKISFRTRYTRDVERVTVDESANGFITCRVWNGTLSLAMTFRPVTTIGGFLVQLSSMKPYVVQICMHKFRVVRANTPVGNTQRSV